MEISFPYRILYIVVTHSYSNVSKTGRKHIDVRRFESLVYIHMCLVSVTLKMKQNPSLNKST